MDTIFALASAQGKAGVSVIRLSGPKAISTASVISGGDLPCPGRVLRVLSDCSGARIDEALVLAFAGPNSFTGEDTVEFQVHGSTSVVSAMLDLLGQFEDVRLSDPGEFTRRALENGKLDLSQVEALADLIDAETEAQRVQAQAVLAGGLADLAERWRKDLIRAASLIEVTIDFADEDVPVDVTKEVKELLAGVTADLEPQIAGVKMAERIRSGFEVAIIGAPNVGKSTLLNALAGREAAITSEYAGTTRDVIEVRMDLAGLPVTLLDTAGLRETDDHVEGIGIKMAKERAEKADLRVFLTEDRAAIDIDISEDDIVIAPKADLVGDGVPQKAVSGKTGQGIDMLITDITKVLRNRAGKVGIATRARHRETMKTAYDRLQSAQDVLRYGPEYYDVAAEDMRSAIRSLEMLVGRVGVENLLDEIFSSFCLGK
ncbi:tRNA uridine-5-carboxymethylaminomethyl(34) synthesis GTPase MnmE [Phaeobacter inhibens]|uniref:tRNA uridine-5-carboxymethylaminomethyl(34) synthesis GTPase MnmE n=1 Tax=Phaeobacter inhibens TaxID=221822 RepID=UPI0021A3DF08|nr:tRNA uridine-5-carboxymethylaminomethyl(34) synthesis GTPase MnmE [Phaeobacter inhibens]UWR52914.1 tRNA uridine-5-carboxymethylaminomethyl(34) synthesis GTPase MnmE [Phaeobacter inhibens]UWR64534.1 tRNA uridine-5-carboxymethylaminomethyl(34) synthesis GTPase MnmE [Phaeobacter inhibens]UWR68476.1 tRNA uridine-5-carboxymethylaminomethyl(34) synthesis GTPase MnmE [Phaeobacter inhibens]UWR72407.1 tRNA uridine-5-carboxymethylaminomethyl(34) synthesis GTPase MnmE [Phaeobacter inhibens]UWS00139.1 